MQNSDFQQVPMNVTALSLPVFPINAFGNHQFFQKFMTFEVFPASTMNLYVVHHFQQQKHVANLNFCNNCYYYN